MRAPGPVVIVYPCAQAKDTFSASIIETISSFTQFSLGLAVGCAESVRDSLPRPSREKRSAATLLRSPLVGCDCKEATVS